MSEKLIQCEEYGTEHPVDECGSGSPTNKQPAAERPHVNQSVIWLQQRAWGGKQNVPATYLHGVGTGSARIRIDGGEEKTVRLKSLRWAIREGSKS